MYTAGVDYRRVVGGGCGHGTQVLVLESQGRLQWYLLISTTLKLSFNFRGEMTKDLLGILKEGQMLEGHVTEET